MLLVGLTFRLFDRFIFERNAGNRLPVIQAASFLVFDNSNFKKQPGDRDRKERDITQGRKDLIALKSEHFFQRHYSK